MQTIREKLLDAPRVSTVPTPFAVWCRGIDPEMGAGSCSSELVYMTEEFYTLQMMNANKTWRCPRCGGDATWDDDNYEAAMDRTPGVGERG